MSTEIATVYDWKELEVSSELENLGSALDKASKLSGALELTEPPFPQTTALQKSCRRSGHA